MTRSVSHRITALAAALLVVVVTTLTMAAPAMAEVSENGERGDPVDPLHAILVLGGIPLLLFVLIALAVYLPAMIRGESISPGAASAEDAWLGGPRRAAGELGAGDETASSGTGGAGTTW